ncbi:MarR family winged helix-turn-helix transcriptional regulator [Pseudonocardia sp. WMMC193]|uniref:MarR family winged helix-turn-helix transcriptional regulator n=1 Tax=Pseudonocardia sp. WMMC193 TaxID=2911965 RepID=UPI001F02336E|nr:MarR family transcriptional regulator [Pseudonocardia sp. WMMC193]MCF7553728.1 winged helix DNA-binding protein [Pseudonocardia sp. WMMC193]
MSERPPQRLLQTPTWLITQISATVARQTREVFDALGAGRYHYAVLCAVEEFGPCSQADIGRRLRIDRKDVAERVLELETAGYLQRRSDPADPRRNVVTLTDEGGERLRQIHDRLTAVQEDLVEPLDTQERAILTQALQKILGR